MKHNNIKELSYRRELLFLEKFLEQQKIPYSFYIIGETDIREADLGLRYALGLEEEFKKDLHIFLTQTIKPNTLMYITDEFYCHYILLLLPNTKKPTLLCIGPFIIEENDTPSIMELLQNKAVSSQWLPTLRHHFHNITCLSSENGLNAGVEAFASIIWGENKFQLTYFSRNLPDTLEPLAVPPDPQRRMDMFSNIEIYEKLYAEENALMNAVAQGQNAKARNILTNIPLFTLEQRTEAIRNLKNHTIIMNTLLRKAAEYGGVHPLYIDQLSSSFAQRIEAATRSDNFLDLWNEMVQKYCTLVNTHTMKRYSLPIQRVITRIDFDLSADLSLKANAQYLNMSPSYLSALFKEETGQTLTDYVNQKRMTQAAYLLTYSQMPISTIAQTCGILDDNYFTKLFKRYMKKTPTQFRQDYFVEKKNNM